MRKLSRRLGGAICGFMVLVVAPAPAADPKGEEWEWTMTVDMQGMSLPVPPTKSCVRPDEGYTPPIEENCQMKNRKVSGGTTTFLIVCGPPTPGQMQGQFTRKGDRIEGRYTHTQGSDTMNVVTNGRRLGSCDPTQPSAGARK
ncbi:MAG: hypothetical protein KatS3mg082_2141 [Nitrospiraceae bacterium]|nr:MAG: hypothetical protein KatS3mg082_2141 [Nitrospiraceae bacterium]